MRHDIQAMTDAERIARVANHADVSEFEVFRRAHLEWHGREADARRLERCFAQYLFHGAAPLWVRHYTRGYLAGHPEALPASVPGNGAAAALSRLADSRLVRYLLS